MNITIIGTGGVGGYFGGKLALAGNQVTFIARGKHLDAINKNGLSVLSVSGNFEIYPATATNDLSVVKNCDLVIIATKAPQGIEIAKQIAPFCTSNTMFLPLQNGVLAVDELKQYLPGEQIIGGTCKIFSMIEAPGVIHHKGGDASITYGELNHQKSERTAWLKSTFDAAGIKNLWTDNIEVEIWKKFLMICSSALLAVTRTNHGELRSLPETRQLLIELYTEIYNVGIAAGINLPDNIVERTMQALDQFPPESNSSLTRDVLEGLPSEIDYQNGSVVSIGKKYGVATPVNRFVYHSILPMELKARERK